MQRERTTGLAERLAAQRWTMDTARQERLWHAFTEAQERSKATGRLKDGIAAGKAYAAFLRAFVPAEQLGGRST
jgi:hypothetical protein